MNQNTTKRQSENRFQRTLFCVPHPAQSQDSSHRRGVLVLRHPQMYCFGGENCSETSGIRSGLWSF